MERERRNKLLRNLFRAVYGSVGAAVWCAMNGASVVRVHDVKETVQALKVVNALAKGVVA